MGLTFFDSEEKAQAPAPTKPSPAAPALVKTERDWTDEELREASRVLQRRAASKRAANNAAKRAAAAASTPAPELKTQEAGK